MISSWSTCHKILHILMFITSFEEQNITYRSCSNLRIHLYIRANGVTHVTHLDDQDLIGFKAHNFTSSNFYVSAQNIINL
ncbi:hypothetical protein B7L44_14810 [Acinetobacter nosocomialis]|nr:hypothetical protein B7L44_14810 [Acinetobacter nosocomialis]